jgi:glycosyltransferase involved in cell wall biosynthesis
MAIVRAEGLRVTTALSEPDRGIYDAMNKGLRLARGDVIGLINSDDFLASPDVLSTIAAEFADPDIDAVYGDLCYVEPVDTSRVVRYWRSSPFRPGLFARGWAPPHPTLYVRREAYERLGGFDLAYPLAADLELMARFSRFHQPARPLPASRSWCGCAPAARPTEACATSSGRTARSGAPCTCTGLAGSMAGFFLGKLVSRGSQFVSRPPAS